MKFKEKMERYLKLEELLEERSKQLERLVRIDQQEVTYGGVSLVVKYTDYNAEKHGSISFYFHEDDDVADEIIALLFEKISDKRKEIQAIEKEMAAIEED